VVFPNAPHDTWTNSIIYRKVVTAGVKTNTDVIYLQGCLAYETMQQIHRTWFCQVVYRNGSFASKNSTSLCSDGNGAD
jgi:hypothetical protein